MVSNFVYYVSTMNFFVIYFNKYVINPGWSIIFHYSCRVSYTSPEFFLGCLSNTPAITFGSLSLIISTQQDWTSLPALVWLYSYFFKFSIIHINSVVFRPITCIYKVIHQSARWIIRIRNYFLVFAIEIRVERYVLHFMVCKSCKRKLFWLGISAFPGCIFWHFVK